MTQGTSLDFRAIFESAPGLYLVLTPDLRIVAVTDAYLEATMTRREHILGRDLFDVFPDNPDDPAASGVVNLRSSLERVLLHRRPDVMAVQQYDVRRPESGGGGFEERHWSPVNSPVLGEGGDVKYIIHRVEDVTEFLHLKRQGTEQHRLTDELQGRAGQMELEIHQRAQEILGANRQLELQQEELESRVLARTADLQKANESLRKSDARFRSVTEAGIIGIVQSDASGNITEANDTFLSMVGYSRDELVAGKVRGDTLNTPERETTDAAALLQLQNQGIALPWEKDLLHKDGRRIPVLVGVAMIDAPNSIAFVVDLTERKRAEAMLHRTEEQLRQAQKMEAIGNLAGGVAHDFNNLLSVILSYSSMLARDMTASDPRRGDLQEIEAAGLRAVNLTRQLLAFGRQQILQPKIVLLSDIVAGMENMLRRLIGEDVELTVLARGQLGKVSVDLGQIEQIVMNLAVNSRDAMPQGGKLTIETANVELDERYAAEHVGVTVGPHVMLAVTDTGLGMDKATQARMFEPFFTTKEKGKGTGLGLATVFGIVKQSGGNVWVYSEPGKGTTIKVYFPRTDSSAPVERKSSPLVPTGTTMGNETILLVEDEDSVRVLACTILRRHGYHVLEGQSGGDALLICEQHTAAIHLMITDVVMPRMSGRQLSERLRALRPQMKVLFMSGYTDNSIVHHGVLDSGVAFLQKPITPETLTRKVREVLDMPAKSSQG